MTRLTCPDCGATDEYTYVTITPGGSTLKCGCCGSRFTDGEAVRERQEATV